MTRRTKLAALVAASAMPGAAQARKVELLAAGSRSRIRVLGGAMQWLLRPAETGGGYFLLHSFAPPVRACRRISIRSMRPSA